MSVIETEYRAIPGASDYLLNPVTCRVFCISKGKSVPRQWNNGKPRSLILTDKGDLVWFSCLNIDSILEWNRAHEDFEAADTRVVPGYPRYAVTRYGEVWVRPGGDHSGTRRPPKRIYSFFHGRRYCVSLTPPDSRTPRRVQVARIVEAAWGSEARYSADEIPFAKQNPIHNLKLPRKD